MEANRSISERAEGASLSLVEDQQEDLFSRTIENPTLETRLKNRQKKADERKAAQNAFKTADDQAKALIEELELEEGEVVRVGSFKIKLGKIEGGAQVSFKTSPRTQLYISEIKD